MQADTTDRLQSIELCADTVCKSLFGQTRSLIFNTASRHARITQIGLSKIYPTAKVQPTKENAIGANLRPQQFLDIISIPIISACGEGAHCEKEVSHF